MECRTKTDQTNSAEMANSCMYTTGLSLTLKITIYVNTPDPKCVQVHSNCIPLHKIHNERASLQSMVVVTTAINVRKLSKMSEEYS